MLSCIIRLLVLLTIFLSKIHELYEFNNVCYALVIHYQIDKKPFRIQL